MIRDVPNERIPGRSLLPEILVITIVGLLFLSNAVIAADNGVEASGEVEDSAITTTISEYPVLCPTENEVASKNYNRAVELAYQNRIEEAKALYHKAIAADSGFCDPMDNLGRIYRSQGYLDSAVFMYRASLRAKPDNPIAFTNLGVVYVIREQLDSASACYKRVVEIDPEDPEGHYGLGQVYGMAADYEFAIKCFERAEELYRKKHSPLVVDALFLGAKCHYNLEHWNQVIENLGQIYMERRDNGSVNLMLGVSHLMIEQEMTDEVMGYLKAAEALGATIPDKVQQLMDETE